jgi:hypothetical protein
MAGRCLNPAFGHPGGVFAAQAGAFRCRSLRVLRPWRPRGTRHAAAGAGAMRVARFPLLQFGRPVHHRNQLHTLGPVCRAHSWKFGPCSTAMHRNPLPVVLGGPPNGPPAQLCVESPLSFLGRPAVWTQQD